MPRDAALAAVVIAVALTLIFLMYALGLRFARIAYDRSCRRIRQQWWPVLAQAAVSETVELKAGLLLRRPLRKAYILREWCRFRALVKTDDGSAFDSLAEQIGLPKVAHRLLHKQSVSSRLLAIRALGYLRDTDSWESMRAFLQERNVAISISAAMALVNIDAIRAMALIIPMLGKRADWPRTQVGRILNCAGPGVVTGPLCEAVRAAREVEAIRLLQYFESTHMHEFDSLVTTLLLTRNEPALLGAALGAVRSELPVEIVARFARHRIWYVRMKAATLLGKFGRREDYRLLEPMLSDPEWWVRYRAAQAIAGFPLMGPQALRKLRDRQKDRFARDILQQALAEVGLA